MNNNNIKKLKPEKDAPELIAFNQSFEWLELDEYVRRESSGEIYYMFVKNDESALGIREGDLLVVDRDKKPESGNLIIAQLQSDLLIMVFRFRQKAKNKLHLATVDGAKVLESNHKTVFVEWANECIVWAVITHVLRNVLKKGVKNNA